MTSLTSMKFKCVGIISNSQKQFIAILEHWIYWSLDQILPNVSSVSWHYRLSKISVEYVTWLLFLVSWMGSWPVLINIKWNNNLVDISSFRRIWQKTFWSKWAKFWPSGFLLATVFIRGPRSMAKLGPSSCPASRSSPRLPTEVPSLSSTTTLKYTFIRFDAWCIF